MTTATISPAVVTPPGRPAPSTVRRPGIGRLWLVELRKLVDTRAGIVLVGVGALLAGVFGGGTVLLGRDTDVGDVARMAAMPSGLLVPVLAILLVTSERQHRTALTTYALVPVRGRVLAAKGLAVVTLAVAVTVLALAAAAIIAPIGGLVTGTPVPWTVDWTSLGWLTVTTVVGALSGWALALLIGNGPGAIVVVLAWPVVALMLSIVPEIREVLAWIDVAAAAHFRDGITELEVARTLAGILVWVGIPGVIGWIRECRTEVR